MAVVLVLVATSTLLGVAGVQSTLDNERIVGNYRAAAESRREAEAGIADFYRQLRTFAARESELEDDEQAEVASLMRRLREQAGSAKRAAVEGDATARREANAALAEVIAAMQQWQQDHQEGDQGAVDWLNGRAMAPGEYHIDPVIAAPDDPLLGDDSGFWLHSDGTFGTEGRRARYEARALIRLPAGETRPFSGLTGCEGVSVSGSGIIDSYDARKGSYGGDNARRANVTVGTVSPEAWVTTRGASPIYGDVASSGGFRAQGSASLHGDLRTNGRVEIQGGGAVVHGDVASLEDVDISSSGTVAGDVKTNGTLRLSNWSSRVDGDVTAAAVSSNRDPEDQVGGTLTLTDDGAGVSPVATSGTCPGYGVAEHYARHAPSDDAPWPDPLTLRGGKRTVVLDAAGLHDPKRKEGSRDVVTALDDGRHLARFASLRLRGSPDLQIGRPEAPVDLVLWVPGEIDIGGGGSFRIAEGSRLTIITGSAFDLGSAIQLGDSSPSRLNAEGEAEAILTVMSTYDDRGDNQPGMKVRGASSFYGQVIAPFSRVDIGGSGDFFGAANGRWIDVSGSGGFHYDESFGELALDPGAGGGEEPELPTLETLW